MSQYTRRKFLKTTGHSVTAAAVGSAVSSSVLLSSRAQAGGSSSVFSAFHDNMVNGNTPADVQEDWVRAGIDACVLAMTQAATTDAAWQIIFPGVTSSSRVAIKVNCLNSDVFPHLATVKGLVQSICTMFGNSFPAANISLFDNNLWRSGKVEACYGAGELTSLGIVHGEDTYQSGQTVSIGGTTMYVSKHWADADYGISLAKMAPHQYYAGGLSGVIKNMMGALSKSNSGSYEAKRSGSGFHDGAPYTAFCDLFSNYGKQHLHLYIVDMLFACRHENESGWSSVVKRITMGTDPCAVDSYHVDKINELGMNVVQAVTKAVPEALADAGVGYTTYNLVEPPVSLGPAAPTRGEIDRLVRDRRGGSSSDGQVKQAVKQYREQS